MSLPHALRIALAKAATDSGFDLGPQPAGDWLLFSSTQAPLRVWLAAEADRPIAALSQTNVARELGDHGTAWCGALPPGAVAARAVADPARLYSLLRRAFQLSRSLPHELLHSFQKKTAALPKATEAERLVVQRIGQSEFRSGLLDYWQGRCAISGLDVPELLRASHAKPWADCASDAERLDVFNGLLLAPHLDAAFDGGFITVEDDGTVSIAPGVSSSARSLLGLLSPLRVAGLHAEHKPYLAWHREKIFRSKM